MLHTVPALIHTKATEAEATTIIGSGREGTTRCMRRD